jgi:iron complex transport system substrate-binding protein
MPSLCCALRTSLTLPALTFAAVVVGAGVPSVAEADEHGASVSQAEAYPVTVEHKYGVTTVEEFPERIAVVGLLEQDTLLALGVVPVATTEWFGEHDGAVWPWAADEFEALDAEPPVVLGSSAEINFENVVAQDPDLILALYSGLTEQDYELLAAIAPTIAQPGEYIDYGIPWEELTRTVGQVVGKAEASDALVADVEAQFAAAQEEHPDFVGATSVMATPYEGVWVYGPEDVRGGFLTNLGFELPADLTEVTGAEFGGDLSDEHLDMLDVDVIVWLDAEGLAEQAPGNYTSLAVHQDGREVFVDSFNSVLGGATSFVTVLSLPYLLDGLTPMLAAAIDGDPATTVPPVEE